MGQARSPSRRARPRPPDTACARCCTAPGLPAHPGGHARPAQAPRRPGRGAEHLGAQGARGRGRGGAAHRRLQAHRPRRRVGGGPGGPGPRRSKQIRVLAEDRPRLPRTVAAQRRGCAAALGQWDAMVGLVGRIGQRTWTPSLKRWCACCLKGRRGSRPTWRPTSPNRGGRGRVHPARRSCAPSDDEVPHAIGVRCGRAWSTWAPPANDLCRIYATVYVERDSPEGHHHR